MLSNTQKKKLKRNNRKLVRSKIKDGYFLSNELRLLVWIDVWNVIIAHCDFHSLKNLRETNTFFMRLLKPMIIVRYQNKEQSISYNCPLVNYNLFDDIKKMCRWYSDKYLIYGKLRLRYETSLYIGCTSFCNVKIKENIGRKQCHRCKGGYILKTILQSKFYSLHLYRWKGCLGCFTNYQDGGIQYISI